MRTHFKLPGVLFLAFIVSRTVFAGEIELGLKDILDSKAEGDAISVIVFMKDRVDIKALSDDLKNMGASRKYRNATVISQLQQKASSAQTEIKAYLKRLKSEGKVSDFRAFWLANALEVTATKDQIELIAQRDDVERIYYNFGVEIIDPVEMSAADTGGSGIIEPGIIAVRAPEVWAMGMTGEGTLVANIDTGVDGVHPALAIRWAGVADPRYAGHPEWAWYDPYLGQNDFPYDYGGHGTHTMGTICGGDPGDSIGVAPGAHWIAAAPVDRGGGVARTVADILLSFEWIVNPDGDLGTIWDVPHVCSNSWGVTTGHGYPPCDELFWSYIDACEAAGIVVVFAAGNEGTYGLRRPADRATDEYRSTAVAAVDGNTPGWPIAYFSSRGPTYCTPGGSPAIKPDISAPGVYVRSSFPNGWYYNASGTSMATPHIAGVVALIRQANPKLDVDEIKQIIYETAYDLGTAGEDNDYGYGMVDAYEAVQLALVSGPPTARFSGDPTAGCAPLTVEFTNESIGEITEVWWNFGDLGTSFAGNPIYIYNEVGSYTVSMIVSGPHGADTCVKENYINVEPVPVADFYATPTCGPEGQYVHFTSSSLFASTYVWNFGDGYGSLLENPYHQYQEAGVYTVTLIVTNSCAADTLIKTDYITIETVPNADFIAIPTSGLVPLMVDFTNLTTNGTLYLWDFGDGYGSLLENPSHEYTEPGYYTVSLTASNSCTEDTETKTAYIGVHSPLFGDRVDKTCGEGAVGVTALDFENDNDADFAVASYGVNYSDRLYTWFNDGTGNFASGGYYSLGDAPTSICANLFNGDDYYDLAVANAKKMAGAFVSVLPNDWYGGFSTRYDFYTGAWYAVSITSADFNNDQNNDIAVVQSDGHNVVVLWNNGCNDFSNMNAYPVEYEPHAICSGDFNGDGYIDIATGNYSKISILINDGNGSFLNPVHYDGTDQAYGILAADLDNDGDIDLAVANQGYTHNDIGIYLNNGTGAFYDPTYYGVVDYPYGIFAQDFDGDGYNDLAVANSGSHNVSILLNHSNGKFGEQTDYYVPGWPRSLYPADFDSDGDYDLAVVGGYCSNNVSVLFNQLDVLPAAPALISPSNGTYTTDHTPLLKWHSVAEADYYELLLDNNNDFSSVERCLSDYPDTSWTVSPALSNGYWYWKVRSHNAGGVGPWSEVRWFKTYTEINDPSCPVLYSFNGIQFIEENPLLTACEHSHYKAAVTDYYHITQPVSPQFETVKFQLRELEDEITYLEDIELIIVDHSSNTQAAVSVDGQVMIYNDILFPNSAVDHNGIDRLPELSSADGNIYRSSESGYLILTFTNTGDLDPMFGLTARTKEECKIKQEEIPKANADQPLSYEFKVEFLDQNGNWIEAAQMPSRENPGNEFISGDLPFDPDQETITMRISWKDTYATDVVYQVIPSDETPQTNACKVADYTLSYANNPAKAWAGFNDPEPLILRKGDILEFSFNQNPLTDPGMTRDYIIRAVGRYEPDYDVFSHLLPDKFTVYGNYPNPFNLSTVLSFYLPEAGHVNIDIYNILGRRVTNLVNGELDAGMNSVTWNSTDIGGNETASGVYFYRITYRDKETVTRKMLLLK
jgi:serine protease AprX